VQTTLGRLCDADLCTVHVQWLKANYKEMMGLLVALEGVTICAG
jgi:hypothetical protein